MEDLIDRLITTVNAIFYPQIPVCFCWRVCPGGCHNGHLQRATVHLHICLYSARVLCGSQLYPRLGVWYADVVANLLAPAYTVQGILPA